MRTILGRLLGAYLAALALGLWTMMGGTETSAVIDRRILVLVRILAALLLVAGTCLVVTGCGKPKPDESTESSGPTEIATACANFDNPFSPQHCVPFGGH